MINNIENKKSHKKYYNNIFYDFLSIKMNYFFQNILHFLSLRKKLNQFLKYVFFY